jgi:hypothetical protein
MRAARVVQVSRDQQMRAGVITRGHDNINVVICHVVVAF